MALLTFAPAALTLLAFTLFGGAVAASARRGFALGALLGFAVSLAVLLALWLFQQFFP